MFYHYALNLYANERTDKTYHINSIVEFGFASYRTMVRMWTSKYSKVLMVDSCLDLRYWYSQNAQEM